ncbi:MAG: SDR family NAD(P)-dependent oxidoreductase [archaeon]
MIEKVLITGGAGFIGINLAERVINEEKHAVILDNLSRAGTEKNIEWLKAEYKDKFTFLKADVRDANAVNNAVKDVEGVYHLAAQVAMTTSVDNPKEDFDINVLGTVNVLEAVRKNNPEAYVVFSSTNKVYGEMSDIKVIEENKRYCYRDTEGINENQNLDFHGPYGCSKGAADQYIRDYGRTFDINTTVFRMSAIYGPHQMGCEDQGWVAYLSASALLGKPITIYGDGKQVRDILYVSDLCDIYRKAAYHNPKGKNKIYNLGGGETNSLSILELVDLLEKRFNRKIDCSFSDWRIGDQKVYVTNISKLNKEFQWKPQISREEGVEKLIRWIESNREILENTGLRYRK